MVVQNAAIPPTAVIMSMLHELPETSHVPNLRMQIATFSLRQAGLTPIQQGRGVPVLTSQGPGGTLKCSGNCEVDQFPVSDRTYRVAPYRRSVARVVNDATTLA